MPYFDIRAFALMRIGIGLLLITDLSIRLADLETFYTNFGSVPLHMLFEHGWNNWYFSIHTISGLKIVQLGIFIFSFLCALMLVIGYRTRLFTILSWFLLVSLHNRNGFILQGGDDLLRMVLFWCIFIPWGKAYSCDKLLDHHHEELKPFVSVAAIAYILQICYIYTGSALLKGPEWDTHFTAVYYAYSLDQIAYAVTKLIYYYPELLSNLTRIAYYFELLVPVLFFIPVKNTWFRTTGILLIVFFHFSNLLTLMIGLFPLIGIVTVIGLLPSRVMDFLEKKCKGIRSYFAASFMGLATAAQRVVRWKKPVYTRTVLMENIQNAVLVFLVFFTLDWNLSNLTMIKSKMPPQLRCIGYSLRLDQSWGMFAPGVFKDDGWYVFEGVTGSGKKVDLLKPGKPLTYDKPENVVAMFKNDRWRKYSENLIFADHTFLRGYFCNYFKRVWNEDHPEERIDTLRIIYMAEVTLPDYQYSKPEKVLLWECRP